MQMLRQEDAALTVKPQKIPILSGRLEDSVMRLREKVASMEQILSSVLSPVETKPTHENDLVKNRPERSLMEEWLERMLMVTSECHDMLESYAERCAL